MVAHQWRLGLPSKGGNGKPPLLGSCLKHLVDDSPWTGWLKAFLFSCTIARTNLQPCMQHPPWHWLILKDMLTSTYQSLSSFCMSLHSFSNRAERDKQKQTINRTCWQCLHQREQWFCFSKNDGMYFREGSIVCAINITRSPAVPL